ncbi:nucleotide-binding universal stress UspA family protein [Kutzneria kofuensis]|uniref:Nucleotide-binding universal stress UspA family protein n=1 Tax=Kutzneria kofuensis TaxID=103725 RepID=A0A7W9KR91_9PSEU|nr:universal stress protein [Kutzneria kofuensis]MBB5897175.1 nucleotide-binding universal stress UspA family protein [Kutzneria kofuensis]
MTRIRPGRVTVGTDGSYWGRAALGWAARHAHRAGLELDVFEADRRFEDLPADLPTDIGTGSVLRPYPLLAARIRSSGADAASMLLSASGESGLLVLGCRGQHKCHLGVGRNALRLAGSAKCDVVIVRGRPQAVHGEFRKVTAWLGEDGDDDVVVARAKEFAKLTRSVLEVERQRAAAPVPEGTDLVVIGGGAQLGLAARTALHHAMCPVYVVR